ncbi:MAG: hypothetical protein ACREEM_51340, partial [Blastocatellia bacterium]
MKRFVLFLALLVFAVSAAGIFPGLWPAATQGSRRPPLGGREEVAQQPPAADALPQRYLNQNRTHKLILRAEDAEVYNRLARQNAIREEFDYRSFKLVIVDEEAAGGQAALQSIKTGQTDAEPIAPRDDLNLIVLNGHVLDTSNEEPLSQPLPADLRQTRMAAGRSSRAGPGAGLYIVQFAGPIQDAWLNRLRATGADVVAYIPNNAYVVRTDRRSAERVARMKDSHPFVQWVGDYEPAYKMSPQVETVRSLGDAESVRVIVQVLDGAAGDQAASNLRRGARKFEGQHRVMKYRNITVTIPASQLAELAASDGVFAIEPAADRILLDEAQGQIVAGNLTGNSPTGPGYLS